jgi:deoxyribose-phosphate aldolase
MTAPLTLKNRNQAIRCLDLTTLRGDDTADRIRQLCDRAIAPLPGVDITVAAVCIYPVFVKFAQNILKGSGVKVSTVAGGFPDALTPLHIRMDEIKAALDLDVDEVDVVIRRSYVIENRMDDLIEEIVNIRDTAGDRTLKLIIAAGDLATDDQVTTASISAAAAGADFVKMSTGKEARNPTLHQGLLVCQSLREVVRTNRKSVGFKASGGIKTAEHAMEWMGLVQAELGDEWINPRLFRIGASTLLDSLAETPTVD